MWHGIFQRVDFGVRSIAPPSGNFLYRALGSSKRRELLKASAASDRIKFNMYLSIQTKFNARDSFLGVEITPHKMEWYARLRGSVQKQAFDCQYSNNRNDELFEWVILDYLNDDHNELCSSKY